MIQKALPPNHEKLYFNYIQKYPEYLQQIKPEYFEDTDFRSVYSLMTEFYNRYTEIPSSHQMINLVKLKGLEDKLPDSLVTEIYTIDLGQYDSNWMKESTEFWIKTQVLEKTAFNVFEYITNTKLNPQNIDEVIQKAKSIFIDGSDTNFDFDSGLNFFDSKSHHQLSSHTFSTGYRFLDTLLDGGYTEGSLIVFGGQPKVGKSIWLCNMAAKAMTHGHNTVYITLEMKDSKIVRRIGANVFDIPITDYTKHVSDESYIRQKIHQFMLQYRLTAIQQPGKMFVKEYPTSTASVHDLETYLKRLEDSNQMKLKVVVVDYINIMKNWRNQNSDNLYLKIKCIAEDLRAMAQRNKWVIVSATQLNRGGWESSELTMDMIAESAGLVHTVDALLGIIQDEQMHAKNIYYLKGLALRDAEGKNTKQRFNVDYSHMRITEDTTFIPFSD